MPDRTWYTQTEPHCLLASLAGWGGSSDRRDRLFVCALARQLWDRLDHEAVRRAVEVAERFADGQVTPEEMSRVHKTALSARTYAIRASRVAIRCADPTGPHYMY